MRWLISLALAAGFVAGCARQQEPPVSHGEPATHWLGEMRQHDAAARKKAVRALGHFGSKDPMALTAVIDAVKDRDAGVRSEAIAALMNLGPDARDALPSLREATKDRDPGVRALAAKAVERIQSGT
jgi:HEAT repeat protein